jgi:hypothetical protein
MKQLSSILNTCVLSGAEAGARAEVVGAGAPSCYGSGSSSDSTKMIRVLGAQDPALTQHH